MQKEKRLTNQLFDGDIHKVPGLDQASVSVAYPALTLKAAALQPFVGQFESIAAVVVLAILDPHRHSVLKDGAVLQHPVWNTCQKLGKVQRGIGVVRNAEKKHLAIQIPDPTDRTVRNVRRKRQWARGDPFRHRAGRCERKGMRATDYAWAPPERVRDYAQVGRSWTR